MGAKNDVVRCAATDGSVVDGVEDLMRKVKGEYRMSWVRKPHFCFNLFEIYGEVVGICDATYRE